MLNTIRLGSRLRAARKAAGFKTSKSFLQQYKLASSTYSQHESGSRTPDDEMLRFYADAFDVNFSWLKNGTGNPFAKTISKKNITLNEELLDLTRNTIKSQKLLIKILEEMLKIRDLNKKTIPIKNIVQNAISLHNKIINVHYTKKSLIEDIKISLASYNK